MVEILWKCRDCDAKGKGIEDSQKHIDSFVGHTVDVYQDKYPPPKNLWVIEFDEGEKIG